MTHFNLFKYHSAKRLKAIKIKKICLKIKELINHLVIEGKIATKIIISRSKRTNTNLIIKKFKEKGKRLVLNLSKPHSNLNFSFILLKEKIKRTKSMKITTKQLSITKTNCKIIERI